MSHQPVSFDWRCRPTWRRASKNTAWCLLGCSIGEFGTLAAYRALNIDTVSSPAPAWYLWALPVVNGIATSLALETVRRHDQAGGLTLSHAGDSCATTEQIATKDSLPDGLQDDEST